MAAVSLSPIGNLPQYSDDDGNPLSGGKLFTYIAGSFSNLALTYTTSDGDVSNANPMVLDAAGRPTHSFWLVDGTNYNFVLTKPDGTTILWSEDNVSGTTSPFSGVSFPLARSAFVAPSNSQIGWTSGSLPADSDTRIRGVYPDEDEGDGNQIMEIDAFLNGSWQTAIQVTKETDFCFGDHPSVTIPRLVVTDSADLPGNYVNTLYVPASSKLFTFGASSGNIQLSVNSPATGRVSTTGAITTSEVYVASPLQQQQIAAGDIIRATIYGTCTSSAGGTVTVRFKIGSNASTADANAFTVTWTAAASGTNIPFKLELLMTVRTLGTTANITLTGCLINNGTTGVYTQATQVIAPQNSTFNSTAGNWFGVSLLTSTASTALTIQNAVMEYVK